MRSFPFATTVIQKKCKATHEFVVDILCLVEVQTKKNNLVCLLFILFESKFSDWFSAHKSERSWFLSLHKPPSDLCKSSRCSTVLWDQCIEWLLPCGTDK